MPREMSIYLDLIRFSAAFIVFVAHSNAQAITGGLLWQLGGYGQTAVILFFVLSGYVIGYVTYAKEKSLANFAIARISRLFSVVIPALIVTLICNEFGNLIASESYKGPWHKPSDQDYLRYLLSVLLVQNYWSLEFAPPNNDPFWSISFEATYYAIFGVLFFIKKNKILLLFGLATFAGPTIFAMAPIWLLGFIAFRINSSGQYLGKAVSIVVFLSTIIILLTSRDYRSLFDFSLRYIDRSSIVGDYIDGLMLFFHLIAAKNTVELIGSVLSRIRRVISFLASFTFALYLFHQPLVRLLAKLSPFIEEPSSAMNRMFIYAGTLLVVIVLGLPAEAAKGKIRNLLTKRFT